MKKKFIKCSNWILSGILSILGFSSCYLVNPPLLEYGTPSATYTVKGAVVNKANSAPIPGIRVAYYPLVWDNDLYGPSPMYGRESNAYVITGPAGDFKLSSDFFPSSNNAITVFAEDIDGEINGLFQSEKFLVSFINAEHSGKTGNWYYGESTVTTTLQLTEINVNE
jgi:putative lipoprotein (rSAM/lipoprotein system)